MPSFSDNTILKLTKISMDRVIVEIQDQIAYISLNRPEKRNALDITMFKAIVDAQKQAAKDKSIRVVILSGNGNDFCSGLDVQSVLSSKSSVIKLLWKWWPFSPNLAQKVSAGWRKLKVPVIAAIHGHCWGGGLQIALGTDFRIASSSASFSIMEAKWGLIPDMAGTLALRDNVAKDQAMRLAMTAEIFDAEQALKLKIISEKNESPVEAATHLAKQLIKRSPDALAQIKKLYHKHWQASNGKILSGETLAQIKILLGKNQSIAVRKEQGKNIPYK